MAKLPSNQPLNFYLDMKLVHFTGFAGLLISLPHPSLASNLESNFSCRKFDLNYDRTFISSLPQFQFCRQQITSSHRNPSTDFGNKSSLINEIIDSSPFVQSQVLNVKSSEYSLKSANASWWPNISMSNSSILFTDILASQNYGGTPATPSSPSTSGTSINPFNGSSLRDGGRSRSSSELTGWTESYSNYTQAYPVIQIQWNFLDPTRYPQIAAAKHQLALSKSQLVQATQQNREALVKAYSEYLFSGLQIGELTSLIALQDEIVVEANERVKLKLLPRLVADQQVRSQINYQSQLNSLSVQHLDAEVKLRSFFESMTDKDEIAFKLQLDSDGIQFLHELIAPVLKAWPFDSHETQLKSIEHSEQLKQLLLQSSISKDNANEQWGAILPTVGLLAYSTYQYTAGSQNYSPPSQPSGAASSTLTNYAGLSFSWNIFDGFATRNQAKAYEQTAASYKAQYQNAAIQLKTTVSQMLNRLNGSRHLLDLYLDDLRRAESIALDTQERSQVGLESRFDVLSAKIDVFESRLQLIQSLASYIKTFGELKGFVGSFEDQD